MTYCATVVKDSLSGKESLDKWDRLLSANGQLLWGEGSAGSTAGFDTSLRRHPCERPAEVHLPGGPHQL